jgi:transaldolase / glucose-6-phosphate isomerase
LSLPAQNVFPGRLETAFLRELDTLIARRIVPRLWERDFNLWPSEPWQEKFVKGNLGWLDLPKKMFPYLTWARNCANEIAAEGFEYIVFVGVGSSNLAAASILQFPGARLGKKCFLLDSTDPASIGSIEIQLDLRRTLFIFADKSGRGVETHSLLLYFLERLKSSGVASPGRHFVALTEHNSYLSALASEYRFIGVFLDPPGISGRFSALIYFGLFLSVICQVDPHEIVTTMTAMAEVCGPSTSPQSNPALSLGAFLAVGAIEGLDRLIILSTNSVERFACCIGTLVGASTSKEDFGIVPIFGQMTYPLKMMEKSSMVVGLTLAGDDHSKIISRLEELKLAGVPTAQMDLSGPEELGLELFKWEIATALACSLLVVNPFHDPDVQEGKNTTSQILQQISTRHEIPPATARVAEAGLELYTEGELRHEVSTLNMSEALRTFLELRDPQGYLALLPFLELTPSMITSLRQIRHKLVSALEIPVLVTSGPRYLHSLGQAYKGGPAKGLFIFLTAPPVKDLDIPGAGYSFGQLQMALALGDFQSLVTHQRPVLRLDFAQGIEQGILQFESFLNSALANIRKATT